MIIDNIINNLDSSTYHTAELHNSTLELYFQGGVLFVHDVSEKEFMELRRNPNDDTIQNLVQLHGSSVRYDN